MPSTSSLVTSLVSASPTTCPFFMTITRSARSKTSWMSWLIRKMPIPSRFSSLTRSPTCRVSWGPSAAVGSSMIRILASKRIARAIATDWRCPPERAFTGSLKRRKFGLRRPITLRACASMAASSSVPKGVMISRPRKRLAAASTLSASARVW